MKYFWVIVLWISIPLMNARAGRFPLENEVPGYFDSVSLKVSVNEGGQVRVR